MKQAEQLPRPALAWIMLAQALLLLPHIQRIPLWVVAVYLFAFGWRVQVFRGRLALPGRWLKVALSGAAAGGILLSFGSLLGMEPMVAFLLTAFALKLTEMQSRKDAYVVIFLGYFVCLTAFLFSQDILLVVFGLVLVWILTTALVCVHRPSARLRDPRSLKLAGGMLMQAFPLMLVLFFLFPRIGPLWSVPLKSHSAKTGMSDQLRPGDVARLSQSDEVAFRAQFDGPIPAASELYWRGIVMSTVENDTWRSLRYFEVPASERREPRVSRVGDPVDYSIIMEPTQQHWLYGLRFASSSNPGVMSLNDYRLYNPVPIENEFQYRVRSWPAAPLGTELGSWRRTLETTLDPRANPLTRRLAQELYQGSATPAEFVEKALNYFSTQAFFYTLEPPVLSSSDIVDEFVFTSRRGFCEHYAYAFAVMMRSAGVPARIVGGYLGGEINPVNRTVIVHEFDAHAWNEVWLEGQGWVRVDPTAAVSPDRVLYGIERAVAAEGSFLSRSPLSPLRYRGIGWVNSLRLRYDALTYRWQSWVTGFDGAAQFDLLRGVFGEISVSRSLTVLLGSGVLTFGALSLLLLRRPAAKSRPPFEAELAQFHQMLLTRGLERVAGEPPSRLVERASLRWPEHAKRLQQLHETLARLVYGAPVDADTLSRRHREVRGQLRQLRFSLRRPG